MTAGTSISRIAAVACITTATVIALAASAAGNYTYGLSQGTDEVKNLLVVSTTSAQLWGLAGVAFEIGAAIFPLATWWAVRRRDYPMALLGGVMSVICIFLVFTATLGFLAMERGSASANVSHSQAGYAMLEDRIASLKKQRAMVPEHRAPAIVAARISAIESDTILWKRSKGCTDVTLQDSRIICTEYRGLQSERAASDRAAELDEKIENARQELRTTKKVANIDGLAEFAETVFGVKQENTNKTRLLAFATGIILLGAFGMTFVDFILASGPVQAASRLEEKPVQSVAAEIPASVPSLQIAAPEPPHARQEQESCEQDLDSKVTILKQRPVTAEQGVEEWARQMPDGAHLFEDLKPQYLTFCGRRKFKQEQIYKVQKLGTKLREMGYESRKMSAKGGKVAFIFPKVEKARKLTVKA
jgi:hypothetical protein